MEKELMIISRIKSPPYEHKREILYQGSPIKISDIPEKLGFTEESRDYFYSIYKIKKIEDGCHISRESFVYDSSLDEDFHSKSTLLNLPITESSKKGLLDFLKEV